MQIAFNDHVSRRFPELGKSMALLACSGGLDSMVLTHLCLGAGIRFCLVHCNFGLRGDESDQDEAFIRKKASIYGIKIFVKHFNTEEYAKSHRLSIQVAARELRYEWFEDLIAQGRGEFVLTAHHIDDQLETFLMHTGRGTGIEGLCGIPDHNKQIRRPLLPFCRAELEAFAVAENIEWRQDASNASLQYDRNRMRHLAVPSLKEAAPGFLKGFATTLKNMKGSRAILEDYAAELRNRLGESTGEQTRYRVADLRMLQPREDYLYLLLHKYGFTDWRAISDLLSGISGKQVTSSTHRILRDRDYLCIRPHAEPQEGIFIVERDSRGIDTPLRLRIRTVQGMGPADTKILYADKETLNEELLLRKWMKGDYFYPLGMEGARKLVSKCFKDAKLNQFEKEAQWLLCSGEDIVWIPGLRADDRFKVTGTTQNILEIEWQE